MAVTLTCPNPQTQDPGQQRVEFSGQLTQLFRKQAWKGPRGHIHRVGVLLVLEASHTWQGDLQPHAHLLVAGSAPGHASSAADWLIEAWLENNPGSRRSAQDASACARKSGVGPWLNYILKGDRLNPAWDDARLEAAVLALTNGSHRVRALGLLRNRKWGAGGCPRVPVIPGSA